MFYLWRGLRTESLPKNQPLGQESFSVIKYTGQRAPFAKQFKQELSDPNYLSRSLHPSLFGSFALFDEEILGQVSRNVSGRATAHRDLWQPFRGEILNLLKKKF